MERPTDRLWLDPARIMRAAGATPDPWQSRLLTTPAEQTLVLCSRQVGKTFTAAAEMVRTALLEAPALVLIVAPSSRQAGEAVQRVKDFYEALTARPRDLTGRPASWWESYTAGMGREEEWVRLPVKVRESALQLHLANGSRVIGLPSAEGTIRGYSSVSLLVLDEAARVPDVVYHSVRPMLAVSRGRLLALSTPYGKRGWFYKEWTQGVDWRRVRIPAARCGRMAPEFLARERHSQGDRWYRQEYECSFEEAEGQLFSEEAIQRALQAGPPPLFGD